MDVKNEDSIQVCIRIKPGYEQDSFVQYTLSQIHLDKNHFGFDKIFPPEASQQEIFETVGTKVISHTLDGYNGCIFVYGQTGSGKTYTMMGDGNGLMQKSFERLFQDIEKLQRTQCIIYCSYYQIYNEQIIDLLDCRKDKKLNIRQDIKKGIFIQNITEETITCESKLQECLNIGMRNRHVGQTMMNRQSSRSHSIFTISFSIKMDVNGMQVVKTPKLHFVDLAGSERQKMTAASGQRLKQAGNINKSLTTLGMVINALASEKTRTHIPYRDSKLTSLLRDSLGGNSKTFLIATISRNILCFQQTLSTLNFANRAKMVKVKAQVNQQSLSTNIQIYKQQIRKLKAQILRLKSQKTPNPTQIRWMTKPAQQSSNYEQQFNEINKKINVISHHLVKNPLSPSVQQLLQQIKRLKPQIQNQTSQSQKINQTHMIDENYQQQQNQSQQQQDPLIQYLSCNNTLLQKIHNKIQEYSLLKQQLRSTAYNNQLAIASLKTPSKFQRQQYQQLLQKRNFHIEELQNQIRQLRALAGDQEIKIQELLNQSQILVKDKNLMTQQYRQKYASQKIQLQRQASTLKNLLRQTNQQTLQLNKRYEQLQAQYKQTKQLYIFAEENYEGQRQLRDQIQKNLLQKMLQIERIRNQYTQKLQQQRQYFEQTEQGLRQQLNVLTQTAQFNQNLITQYQHKLEKQKCRGLELETIVKGLEDSIKEILEQKKQIQGKLAAVQQQLQNTNKQLADIRFEYVNMMEQKSIIINTLQQEKKQSKSYLVSRELYYQGIIRHNAEKMDEVVSQLQNTLKSKQRIEKQMGQQLLSTKKQYQHNITRLQDTYQQNIQNKQQEISQLKNICENVSTQLQKTSKVLTQTQNQLSQYQSNYKRLQEQTCIKIQQIYQQTKAKLQSTRVLEIENEELKKQYKILQKQNYKIKSKYTDNSNSNKTQEQLSAKVNYYEQKFKLMSIEYQKAMEVVKKLKQKQLNQAQKIANLEQSQKLLKISYQSEQHNLQNGSLLRNLSQQNTELKQQLELIRNQTNKQQSVQSYMNKMSIQQEKTLLKEKQEYFKKKIQQSINRWDPSKENVIKNRSLEQLIQSWEEIEGQSCKKFDAIAKGIKRQQKLKTQNNLIIKQNIYLKEQIGQLQKQMEQKMSHPRKIVKLDLSQISEDSLQ